MYYKKLVGTHVYLSPADSAKETPILTRWWNEDQEIAANNGFYDRLLDEAKVAEMLQKWQESSLIFAIVEKASDTFMGHISLFDIGRHEQYATIGIYIGEDYRHQGYGQEAMQLLIDYLFQTQRFLALHLEVFAFNERGRKIYRQLGFQECGCWHQALYHNGEAQDIVMMELLRSDWLKR